MNIPSDQPEVPRAFKNDQEVQYVSLRRLVQATAVSVLILTGTVFIYLYRQVVLVRRQTAELVRYLAEVDRAGMPEFVEKVRASFNDYRKTHPDFNPIYTRFFGTNEAPVTAKVSPAPSPAANAAPKPTEKK
jgi:hypothetical protein